jgi:hypothetical protein
MKAFACSLFGVGLLVAISGGAKMPDAGLRWPSTLPISIAGAIAAIAGVVLWHRQQRASAAAPAGHADTDPFALLAALLPKLQALGARAAALPAGELCGAVDTLLEGYVLPFTEARQRVTARLGMRAGAELLVTAAYGERMLNRVWSAASDGHLPEALACLSEAIAAFEAAAPGRPIE